MLADLHQSSGLTWDQMARLFGVGRRAVHGWAMGATANQHHQALAAALAKRVRELDASPEQVKVALFAPRPGGSSIYTDLIRERAAMEGPPIQAEYSIVGWSNRHNHEDKP